MSLAALQERQTQLILQRSQGKDIVEQAERELGAIQFATQELNAQIKEQEEATEAARKAAEEEMTNLLQGEDEVVETPKEEDLLT